MREWKLLQFWSENLVREHWYHHKITNNLKQFYIIMIIYLVFQVQHPKYSPYSTVLVKKNKKLKMYTIMEGWIYDYKTIFSFHDIFSIGVDGYMSYTGHDPQFAYQFCRHLRTFADIFSCFPFFGVTSNKTNISLLSCLHQRYNVYDNTLNYWTLWSYNEWWPFA